MACTVGVPPLRAGVDVRTACTAPGRWSPSGVPGDDLAFVEDMDDKGAHCAEIRRLGAMDAEAKDLLADAEARGGAGDRGEARSR